MAYKDPERKRASDKEYRKSHIEEAAAYRKNHRSEKTAYDKKYYENHREKLRARNKEYHENHREKMAAYAKEWFSTLKGKIINALCARLCRELKGRPRAASALELLGCTVEYFKAYIEIRFKPGMFWNNWTRFGWNLDHVEPITSFDLSDPEQQRKCFHYSNLQPLWWRDHLIKNAKYKEAVKSR